MKLSYPKLEDAIAHPSAYKVIYEDGYYFLCFKHPGRGQLRTQITSQIYTLFLAYREQHRRAEMFESQLAQAKREITALKAPVSRET